jgi:hypothetical protein
MQLVRLVWLTPGTLTADWEHVESRDGDVTVRLGGLTQASDTDEEAASRHSIRMLVATIPLPVHPRTAGRLACAPETERLLAERAIEQFADTLGVAHGSPRRLWSPAGFAVAFKLENAIDYAWAQALDGVDGAGLGRMRARFNPHLPPSLTSLLDDRPDGVSLLAEAWSQEHDVGRFRELVRFFERAFSCSAERLVALLATFLSGQPRHEFAKSEIKHWIVKLRGAAVHADRGHGFVREREIAWVTDRMLLAAYDVLLNKVRWNHRDVGRRAAWAPDFGPAGVTGDAMFAQSGLTMNVGAQFFDQYGAFPVRVAHPRFALGLEYWPRNRVPMSWKGPRLHVIASEPTERPGEP